MALPARKPVISPPANPASACSEGEFLTLEVGMIVRSKLASFRDLEGGDLVIPRSSMALPLTIFDSHVTPHVRSVPTQASALLSRILFVVGCLLWLLAFFVCYAFFLIFLVFLLCR